MPADFTDVSDNSLVQVVTAAAVSAYEIVQTPTGGAGVNNRSLGYETGNTVNFSVARKGVLPKTSGFVALAGNRAYWDHSANAVYYKPATNDRDYYLGRFAADAASADTTCTVIFGHDPPYDLDLTKDAFDSIIVGTPAAGGFGYPVTLGGNRVLELTATSEAQKVDLLSRRGFAVASNPIVEAIVNVSSDGAGTVVDFNIGLANGTNSTNTDNIGESLFIHLDANNTNINAESDDNAAGEVAATDTTTDYTEGTAFEVWLDCRNPADIQVYVNGNNVLPATVFTLSAAVGPLYGLIHLEKSSSTDTYKVSIDRFTVRTSEQ